MTEMLLRDIWSATDYQKINVKKKNILIWGCDQVGLEMMLQVLATGAENCYLVDCYNFLGCQDEMAIYPKGVISKEVAAVKQDSILLFPESISDKDRKWITDNFLTAELEMIANCEIQQDIIDASNIYIYGSGSSGRRTWNLFRESNIDIEGFLDSNEEKAGIVIDGKPVCHLGAVDKTDLCIVLSTAYYKEIIEILDDFRLENTKVFLDYANSLFWAETPLKKMPILKWTDRREWAK